MNWADFEVEKIGNIFYVIRQPKSCNIGVCMMDGAALIIDSGYSPKKMGRLKKLLEKNLNCRIELLLNTHYHSDHTFGNQVFDCPILSSDECRRNMEGALASHWSPREIAKGIEEDPTLADEWQELDITLPTETFKNEKRINFKGINVEFQRVGGHTSCSSVALFADYRIIFAGDIVFAERYPTLLWDGNPHELILVLRKIIRMDVDVIIPGHGVTCGKSSVGKLADYFECLANKCATLLAEGKTDEEILNLWDKLCPLPDIPMDQMRHERNIGSVVKFLKKSTV